MDRRSAIANNEAAITRWTQYTDAARQAGDDKRIAYGEARMASAARLLARLLRP